MVTLDADRFLNELGKLFKRTEKNGSVSVTMKRTDLKPRKSRQPHQEAEYKCLIRASDGKKKISTTVNAKEHTRFQDSYATILKAHMDALKKREKVKTRPEKKVKGPS